MCVPIFHPHLYNTQTSTVFRERCTALGIVDCVYAAYAYDAVWTVATALNSFPTSDLLHMAIAESNFSEVSVKIRIILWLDHLSCEVFIHNYYRVLKMIHSLYSGFMSL